MSSYNGYPSRGYPSQPFYYPEPVRAFIPGGALSPVSYSSPNYYAQCLAWEKDIYVQVANLGGFRAMCCPASHSGDNPPWSVMPPDGKRFQQIGSLDIQTIVEGTQTTVVQFRVPTGFDGVAVTHFNLALVANPFAEGSGDVTWRIRNNRRYIKDYGNITTTLGSLASPAMLYRGGLRLYSNQLINYSVTLAAGAIARMGGVGRIVCGILGWWYPET